MMATRPTPTTLHQAKGSEGSYTDCLAAGPDAKFTGERLYKGLRPAMAGDASRRRR